MPKSAPSVNWFTVKNDASSTVAEILIYQQIGKDAYNSSGVGAEDFLAALKDIPENKPILVRINSPGGNVWDALAIYNALTRRQSRVTTHNDGIAASSASLIFLAGGTRIMPTSALLMMHNPTDICYGGASEMREHAAKLDAHKSVIASIYVANSNMKEADVVAAMDAETWLTGQQCLDRKLVHQLVEDQTVQNSFDLSGFRHAPRAIVTNPKRTENIIMNRQEMITGIP